MSLPHPPPSFPRRLAVLAYGLAAYATFLLTFLALAGFVMDLGLPVSLRTESSGPLWPAVGVDAGLFLLFGLQHTVMARAGFKRLWRRVAPRPVERATFVLATCGVLITMMVCWRPLPGVVWRVEAEPAVLLIRSASWAGWGLVLVSSFLVDHFDLFGLRQVFLHFRGEPYREPRFQERSFYRVVRHPLYAGFLLATWATPVMTAGHLAFVLGITAYTLIGTRFEEHGLVASHGEAYREYQRRVPMLLPLPRRAAARRREHALAEE